MFLVPFLHVPTRCSPATRSYLESTATLHVQESTQLPPGSCQVLPGFCAFMHLYACKSVKKYVGETESAVHMSCMGDHSVQCTTKAACKTCALGMGRARERGVQHLWRQLQRGGGEPVDGGAACAESRHHDGRRQQPQPSHRCRPSERNLPLCTACSAFAASLIFSWWL